MTLGKEQAAKAVSHSFSTSPARTAEPAQATILFQKALQIDRKPPNTRVTEAKYLAHLHTLMRASGRDDAAEPPVIWDPVDDAAHPMTGDLGDDSAHPP